MTRLSRMNSESTRLLKLPALAAMWTACSAENVCAGLVSMACAMNIADVVARLRLVAVLLEPAEERDLVELAGARHVPRPRRVHLRRQLVEQVGEPGHLGLHGRGDRQHLAGERPPLAVEAHVDRVALAVPLERLEPQLVEHREQRVLVGRDPLPADLEVDAVDLVGPQPSADALTRLEHQHRLARALQGVRRRQSSRSGSHDQDIDVFVGHFELIRHADMIPDVTDAREGEEIRFVLILNARTRTAS